MEGGSTPTNGDAGTQQRELIRACSWCEKVEGADGEWNTITPEIFEVHRSAMNLTHGICPPCFIQNMAAISPQA